MQSLLEAPASRRHQANVPLHTKQTLSAAWPALLLASVILLPWLGKAHTIDDTTFLLMAEHVLKDPLHPTAFEMVADGNRIRLSSQLVSGPVMAYLLVPSVLLGGAEWAAHIVQYLLILSAILATVSLAFRLGMDGRGARLAGLLLASAPAVMVLATTSMADVPAMAFGVLGMERFVAWRQDCRWSQCSASAVFFALAALSRPHLILILVVAVLLECSNFRALPGAPASRPPCPKRTLLLVLPLFLSALLTVFVVALTADPARAGSSIAHATFTRFQSVNTASNLAAFSLHWIFVFPLALLWIFLGIRWKRVWRNPALWLAPAIPVLIWILDRDAHKIRVRFLALACIGAFVLFDILVDAWQRRDSIQLFLWIWLLISLPVIAYVQLPSKYLVPSAPAMAILLAMLVQRSSAQHRFVRWVAASAGIVLALLIIAADAEFSAIGRRISAEQIAPRVAKGARVWINSEWGFAWYAMKAGAIQLANQPPHPLPGDVVVSSAVAPHLTLDLFPNRQLVTSIKVESYFGRIMTRPAGFYSNGYGFLPWTFRNGELDTAELWKIW